jgi:tetrahydromethanopterin S-methyltransferase subunit A
LLALAENGVGPQGRIIGAHGKCPVLCNIPREAVEAFRTQVRVLDLIGCQEPAGIVAAVDECLALDPGPAAPFAGLPAVPRTAAHPSDRLVLDPAGYFVIFSDPAAQGLLLEHYTSDGVLDHVVEGRKPSDLYVTAIRLGLVTRLDHAAYLGQELARAEQALQAGRPFFQDAAPGEECPEELLPPPPTPT